MSSVLASKQRDPRRSYITHGPFHNDIFDFATTTNYQTFTTTGQLVSVSGANASNCPKGRFLYENGKKLFPSANPGITTYMVGVYDPVSFLKGYIDPNSKMFSPMHQDKPISATPLTSTNKQPFGINPENEENDQGPGVFTLANSYFGANVDISGVMDAGEVRQETFRLVPTGSVISFIAQAAPGGWLLCDGSAISRETYARLFAIIGTTYGSGDNSTTFNLPDMRGRVPIGFGTGSGLTTRNLAATGGAETHTLTIGEMPSHNHGGVTGPGNHSGAQGILAAGGGNDVAEDQGTHTHSISAQGGDGAHNNMQPFLVLNYIIKY